MAFFLDAPRVVHCFEVEVATNPKLEAPRRAAGSKIDVALLDPPTEARAGEEIALRFRLTDRSTGQPVTGLEDVKLLTFRASGQDQKRLWTTAVGDGVYEGRFSSAQPGTFFVFLESDEADVQLGKMAPFILRVGEARRIAKADE